MTLFPKQSLFVFFFFEKSLRYSVDSFRSVLWSTSEKYCGHSPICTLVNLREVLWTIFDKYFGQSPRSTVDSLRKIIFILDVPSKPKHRVDHFHALTPMSCDAPCINAMQVSLHVISCCMYATCHMQHINHTLHVKCHG